MKNFSQNLTDGHAFAKTKQRSENRGREQLCDGFV